MALIPHFLTGPAASPVKQVGTYKTVAENVLDFSLEGKGVLAADVVRILVLPINAVVSRVKFEVLEAEGGTATCTVGDFDSQTVWDDEINLELVGDPGIVTVCSGGLIDALSEKHYRVPGGPTIFQSITMIPNEDLNNCKIWFSVEYSFKEVFENI